MCFLVASLHGLFFIDPASLLNNICLFASLLYCKHSANANLAATLVLMKDAREKFDTVSDCEPAIERLHRGVVEMEENRQAGGRTKGSLLNRNVYTEQDVYAAADSMEILRDAFAFFAARKSWRSSPSTLNALERCHRLGIDAMSLLITSHLKKSGQAVRPKRKKSTTATPPTEETAQQVRETLSRIVLISLMYTNFFAFL